MCQHTLSPTDMNMTLTVPQELGCAGERERDGTPFLVALQPSFLCIFVLPLLSYFIAQGSFAGEVCDCCVCRPSLYGSLILALCSFPFFVFFVLFFFLLWFPIHIDPAYFKHLPEFQSYLSSTMGPMCKQVQDSACQCSAQVCAFICL